MNKKAIAILGAIFLLIVGTLGFLIYAKYFGSKPASTTTPPPSQQNTTTPPSTGNPTDNSSSTPAAGYSGNIIKLDDGPVVSPALFFNGQGLTFFDKKGDLFQGALVNANNGQLQLSNKKQLTIPQKAGITKVFWPAKGEDFIAQLTDPSGKTSYSYYSSNTGSYTDLPSQIESFDWMPNGNQIAYVWVDGGKANLSIANPDATNYKPIADMWQLDNTIKVSPDGSQMLFFENAATATENAINSVSIDGKQWKGLVKNGYNFGALWSPDGQKFLFNKRDVASQQYQLWVYNMTSGEVKNLGLFTTVDKTVWDPGSMAVYAAVPQTGTAGSNSLTVDAFYRVDINTMDKKQYPSSVATPVDAREMLINFTADKIFFKNAQDSGLYYLDLTQTVSQ